MSVELVIDPRVEEHVQADRLYYAKRSPFASVDKWVAGSLLVVGIVAVMTVGVRWWTLIWFVLAPVEFFNRLSIAPLVIRYRFKRNPKFAGPTQLRFEDEAIRFKTTSIDSTLKWSLYDGYLEDDQLILLTYGPSYSVIPKRCFKDAAELDAFRSLVTTKVHEIH